MAAIALVNAFAHVHGHDFSTDSNTLQLDTSVTELDVTRFGPGGWRELIGGVKSSTLNMSGFWEAGAGSVDVTAFTDLGTVNRAVTFGPEQVEARVCYLMRAGQFNYQLFGNHGEAAPFSLQGAGSDGHGVIRGQLGVKKAAVSTTGVKGSTIVLGATAADEFLYATLHVFAAGATITVLLESDDNADFTSPTTRATFSEVTAVGGTWATRVAGAITDTYYRFNVSAITGNFTIACAAGIA